MNVKLGTLTLRCRTSTYCIPCKSTSTYSGSAACSGLPKCLFIVKTGFFSWPIIEYVFSSLNSYRYSTVRIRNYPHRSEPKFQLLLCVNSLHRARHRVQVLSISVALQKFKVLLEVIFGWATLAVVSSRTFSQFDNWTLFYTNFVHAFSPPVGNQKIWRIPDSGRKWYILIRSKSHPKLVKSFIFVWIKPARRTAGGGISGTLIPSRSFFGLRRAYY